MPRPPVPTKPKPSPDDISTDDIDSWLVGDMRASRPTSRQPLRRRHDHDHGLQGRAGAVQGRGKPPSVADDGIRAAVGGGEAEAEASDETLDEQVEDAGEEQDDAGDDEDEESEKAATPEEEFIDQSNPFYAAKKAQKEQAKNGAGDRGREHKATFKDSSDAANDILRKLMERRRASKS